MSTKKLLNGKIVEMNAEELAQREVYIAEEEKLVEALRIENEQKEQEEINKQNAKASAQAKLEALGLTEEEIKALIG